MFYNFYCKKCKICIEIEKSMHDPTIPLCSVCGQKTIRVYSPLNIVWRAGGYNRFQANGMNSEKEAKAKFIGEHNLIKWSDKPPKSLDSVEFEK